MSRGYTSSKSGVKGMKVNLYVDGLDEYAKKVIDAGGNIDKACEKAITESSKVIWADITKWAEKHRFTGATKEGVLAPDIKKEGNYIYTQLGISSKQKKLAWHAVFVEFGSPTNDADPGIRNAFHKNRKLVRDIQIQVLQEEGVPVDAK